MKVVHVSPTYFAPESILGGGERFAEELSRAMSKRMNVRFVSFGAKAKQEWRSATYERVILRSRSSNKLTPFSGRLFNALWDADIIHCHQYYVLPTFLSVLTGTLLRRKVFVSDLGGGGWTPAYHIDQSRWIRAHLPISQYAARNQRFANGERRVIYGGVDLDLYPPRGTPIHDGSVVFLGRILPHKGIHFLIRGLPDDVRLKVIGPIGDREYYANLRVLAELKNVEFLHGLCDTEIRDQLGKAMVLVHPTPVDSRGNAGANELFGLAVVEAMARGCVPIVSNAASLPELVQHEISGLVVPPNEPELIRGGIQSLREQPLLWTAMSLAARRRVETEFTWERVVDRCLNAYELL